MWKRVLKGLLKKNKNRQSLKIGTTDGYYYQFEFDNLINLPNATHSFMEAILAYTQKNNAFEHQNLVDFLNQMGTDGLTTRNINQYFLKHFAFEPHVSAATAQGKIIEGKYLSQKNTFKLNKPPVLFKYQFFFSVASLLVYSLQQMSENQITELDKKLNQTLEHNAYLLIKAG